MENRNLFITLVLACVLAPGLHYFIAGKDLDNSTIRNVLVGVQILGAIVLLLIYGKKRARKNS